MTKTSKKLEVGCYQPPGNRNFWFGLEFQLELGNIGNLGLVMRGTTLSPGQGGLVAILFRLKSNSQDFCSFFPLHEHVLKWVNNFYFQKLNFTKFEYFLCLCSASSASVLCLWPLF